MNRDARVVAFYYGIVFCLFAAAAGAFTEGCVAAAFGAAWLVSAAGERLSGRRREDA
ncbi:MAG: hypothetical protein KGL53_05095 [Elusimicrobia bacterium]|nr:hypothetical protein [Elusimicrobiota bacterium]